MRKILPVALVLLLLSGCSSTPPAPTSPTVQHQPQSKITADTFENEPTASPQAQEAVFYALMLMRTKYKFGGKNPSAGLDCSGLVSVSYLEGAGIKLTGNAASLARQGRATSLGQLRAGDLLFFNTLGRPFSHVGIYIGRSQFVHAPNARGSVRVEKLTTAYWAKRFEMARTII